MTFIFHLFLLVVPNLGQEYLIRDSLFKETLHEFRDSPRADYSKNKMTLKLACSLGLCQELKF